MTNNAFKSFLLFFLLLCSIVMSCPFSVSAALVPSDEEGVYFEYDDSGNKIATVYSYDLSELYVPFVLNRPNYSIFDPGYIDWNSFPSYIRQIAYTSYYNINLIGEGNPGDYFKFPFIMVTTNGDTYSVFAGWDCALYYRSNSGTVTVGYRNSDTAVSNPVLYKATFDVIDNSVVSDWSEIDSVAWGSNGVLNRFPGSQLSVSDQLDVYTYGVNASVDVTGNYLEKSYVITSGTDVAWTSVYNAGRGILDMPYYGFPSSYYNSASNLYISSFIPRSYNANSCVELGSFGLNSTILTSDAFVPLDNLPYGLNSSVIGFMSQNTLYHFITDYTADSYLFRCWASSDSNLGKLTVGIVSSAPIYRIGYTSAGSYASVNGAVGLTKCVNNLSSGSSSWHKTMQYYADKGYYVYVYNLPAGSVGCTISRNSTYLTIDSTFSDFLNGHYFDTYPSLDSISYFIEQEQNSLINQGNEELSGIHGELTQSGDSNFSTTLPDDSLSDYNEAESELLDDYDPDDLDSDLEIEMDESALSVIWQIFDKFVKADNQIFALILSCLGIGIISLILGR